MGRGTPAGRPFGDSGGGGSGARGPVGESEHGRELDHVLAGGGESQALHVHEAMGQGHSLEETIDLLVAPERGQVVHDLAARARFDRRTWLDLHASQAGGLGQVAEEEHICRGGRPVGEDAAEGLEAAVEQDALLGKGAGRLGGQQRGEEGEKH